MIISFRHKGLQELLDKEKSRLIDRRYWDTLIEQLNYIDVMERDTEINDMYVWRPHRLTGKNPHGQDVNGHWSLKVSGNWRVTYYFNNADGTASLVDFLDYH